MERARNRDIKLMRNKQTGKMRVLMRREQVLKLCANHQITSDMKLQPNAGSEKSWVWSTLADFSEQECKAERLAVRFKSEVIAKQFKKKFEECQEMLKNQTSVKPNQDKQGHKEVKEGLLTKFKAAEGIWKCDICMVRNDSDKNECAACGSLKPGAEASKEQKKHVKPLFSFGSGASKSGATFSFGSTGTSKGNAKPFFPFGPLNQTPNSSSAVSFSFGSLQQGGNISVHTGESKKVGWECDICMVRNDSDKNECAACGSLKPGAEPRSAALSSGTGLGLGSGASSSGTGISLGPVTSSSGAGLRLGSGASSSGTGLRLGSGASPSGTGLRLGSGASSSCTGISLGPVLTSSSGLGSGASSSGAGFSFGSTGTSKGGNIRVQSEESAGSTLFASQASTDHNESAEDDHEGTHFEPVIPLPDKIDVKTGEEDDEVMFSTEPNYIDL
ncbi:E3 SUMO-protein ligase RanBP2 [Desmophyllum pertusum]|uniref:Nuclear pore complex protein Nup153 n=1 Tax=Desmophyllum pertusum TaxID=174260 RepID=A0A9X0A351_9CNID|nr:E3 SUMO-protein ligase RanBP2 [Desmophyllum pertusum]